MTGKDVCHACFGQAVTLQLLRIKKSMDPKDKLCADCWRRGTDAMNKQNWDYAIEMFGTCVNIKPENVVYRQTLHGVLQKKYDNNGTGAGRLAKSKLIGIRSRIKKARSKEDWSEMDKAAVEGLRLNPWDVGLHLDVAEAARARDFMEVAEFALKCAFLIDMKNKEIASQYGDILQERGHYNDAVKIWEHIARLDPSDIAAQRKITEIQTVQTTVEKGFEDAENTQDVLARTPGGSAPGETVAPGESVESDLRHAIRKEPDKVEHYQKLASHLRSEKRLEEARELLQTALEMSGNDPAYREQLEDVELDIMRKNRDLAREAARSGDEKAKENLKKLEIELVKRELQVFLSREERYPADMKLRFEIALRFMRFNKWAEAIPRLQKASNDSRLKAQALARLGMCFYKDGKVSLARGQLERAIPELNHDRDPKLYKEAHYNLARILEELGDTAGAEEHYGEILVVDYDYRDARQRLESLQAGET